VMPEIETRQNAGDRGERQRKTFVNMPGKPDGREEEEGTFLLFFFLAAICTLLII
jgi:hypothetical protein